MDAHEEEPATEPITRQERFEVATNIIRLLRENYIFPETAQEMVDQLDQNINDNTYDSITDTQKFAHRLTEDLQAISKDKHLKVSFNPKVVQEFRAYLEKDDGKVSEERLREMQFGNFGFKEVKILLGNIGYIDLRQFCDTKVAGETAVAAMNFVGHCDALIFDLRNNGGGSPSMIQLLTSYLYDDRKPVHLNTFYWRPEDELQQFWTLPYVPGKRLPNADVFVLTARCTFSAAEEFTYNLQNLKRATIVGETTGGGAHPGGTEIANDRFLVWVPKGRAINPITKINWEGTGVEPDIKVAKEKALETAHVKALENLISKNTEPTLRSLYAKHLETLKDELKKDDDNESPLAS